MKKSLLAIGIIAALTSCLKKQDGTTEINVTDQSGTVIISGKVMSNHENTVGTDVAVATEGVAVVVSVANDELFPNSNNAQGYRTYSTTTDAEGNYSLTVTVGPEETEATITFPTRVDTLYRVTESGLVAIELVEWDGDSDDIDLIAGVAHEENYFYYPDNISSQTGTVTIMGQLTKYVVGADDNGNLNDVEIEVPAEGVIVTGLVNNETFSATSDADGNYSMVITVPEGGTYTATIFWNSFDGELTYTNLDGSTVSLGTVSYEFSTNSYSVNSSNSNAVQVRDHFYDYNDQDEVEDLVDTQEGIEFGGDATFSGTLWIRMIDSSAGNPNLNVPLANYTFTAYIDGNDLNNEREVELTTDADGDFTHTFNIRGDNSLYVELVTTPFTGTRDTVAPESFDVIATGDNGVFGSADTDFWIEREEILIDEDFTITNFTAEN